jgi:CheY-like chemotaxis protein/HPt (histidine-containing phosphotransfer) domain-containing protein/anti-sigma regulatory factor (Ser/Thr protein kinase)
MAQSRSFNLLRTIEAIVDLVSAEAAGRGLALRTDLSAEADCEFRFDAWRVQQIASHLLANAVANSEAGTVTLSLSRRPGAAASAGRFDFELAVEDTGPGIGRAHLERLFGPIGALLSETASGPGLGLALCRELSDAIGADLSIGSLLGGGTRIEFRFAVFGGPAVDPLPEPLQARLQKSRALVVDPHPDMRGQLIARLRAWGVRATAADGGLEAVDAIHAAAQGKDHFTMAFIDSAIQEADMHGIIAALQVSPCHRTAVLVATGVGNELLMSNDLARRSQAMLESPVRLSQLFDCLAQMNVDSTGALRDVRTAAANRLDEKRVLVVEDNIVNQCVAVEILRRLGIVVDVAENGGEALAAVTRRRYDLVFMDCHMPVMDGFEAVRNIRAGEIHNDVPIVALTACGLPGDRQRCLDAGMNDFLCKPFTRRQIQEMLEKWARVVARPGSAPQLVDAADDEILNGEVLAEIRSLDDAGDDSIFREILEEYLSSSRQLVSRLETAVGRSDASEIGQCAHALKSSSAALGAAKFAAYCRRLEERARTADLDGARREWQEARAVYRQTIDALGLQRQERVAC